MKDHISRGMIAGLAGTIPQLSFSLIIHWLTHAQKLMFYDFAGVLAFNRKPSGFLEICVAESIVIGQMAVFGVLFALLLQVISSRNLIFKGGFFGGFCWFTIYVLAVLNKVAGVYGVIDFKTAVINLTSSLIWGIGMAWTYQLLNRRSVIS